MPVLASEVHDALDVKPGGVYLDGTFGAGGHTRAILDVPGSKVIAVDCDPVVRIGSLPHRRLVNYRGETLMAVSRPSS